MATSVPVAALVVAKLDTVALYLTDIAARFGGTTNLYITCHLPAILPDLATILADVLPILTDFRPDLLALLTDLLADFRSGFLALLPGILAITTTFRSVLMPISTPPIIIAGVSLGDHR